jgi:unconventional prefoldin RPB5 interactor 1
MTEKQLTLTEVQDGVRKLTKFEQTKEELETMVETSRLLKVEDVRDKDKVAIVKAKRIELRKIEIAIEKRGKEYRDVFNAVNKEIIGKEKELKAITSPEIERLTAIEDEAEAVALREKREAMLPVRKERLLALDADGFYVKDDEMLLDMDADAFEKFYNECSADKNEKVRIAQEEKAEADRKAEQERLDKERAELEAEKARIAKEEEEKAEKARKEKEAEDAKRKAEQDKLDEEKRKLEADRIKLEHEKELKEAEEKAKVEAEKKAEEDKKRKEAEEKAEEERVAKEEADRKAEMEKREAYKQFLKENGWTAETRDQFETREVEGGYELWKKVGVFNK